MEQIFAKLERERAGQNARLSKQAKNDIRKLLATVEIAKDLWNNPLE